MPHKTHETVKPTSVPPVTRNRMKAVRHSGTKAEILLRDALTALGLEYQVDARPIPTLNRRADILFPEEKVAVFVDGCFWHGCPVHGTQSKTNTEFWAKKIETNKRRDADTNRRLEEAGWAVVRIWEHENPTTSARKIVDILRIRGWRG